MKDVGWDGDARFGTGSGYEQVMLIPVNSRYTRSTTSGARRVSRRRSTCERRRALGLCISDHLEGIERIEIVSSVRLGSSSVHLPNASRRLQYLEHPEPDVESTTSGHTRLTG